MKMRLLDIEREGEGRREEGKKGRREDGKKGRREEGKKGGG